MKAFWILIWGLVLVLPVEAQAHRGLLSDAETGIALANARRTVAALFPKEKISACRPFDIAQSGPPAGLAYCELETPLIVQGEFEVRRGPDLLCSYTRIEFCGVAQPQ